MLDCHKAQEDKTLRIKDTSGLHLNRVRPSHSFTPHPLGIDFSIQTPPPSPPLKSILSWRTSSWASHDFRIVEALLNIQKEWIWNSNHERCSPRGYIPRVCFVKHVNSLLGSVFVSLLWFQDSSNPMMFRFNAHRWSEPWGKFVFLRIFWNISRAYVWTFRVHMNIYLRKVASEGINHHVEHCIFVPASRVLFSSRCQLKMRVFWHQGPQEDRKSTEET